MPTFTLEPLFLQVGGAALQLDAAAADARRRFGRDEIVARYEALYADAMGAGTG